MKKIKITVFTLTSREQGIHFGEIDPVDPSDESKVEESTVTLKLDPDALLKKCLDEVKTSLGDTVLLHVVDYEDASSVQIGMDTLNLALESAGTERIESPEKFTMFVNSSAPLIVVNNRIAFTGIVPPSVQIISRVKAALR